MKALTLVCVALMITSCFSVTQVELGQDLCSCAQIQYQPDCQAAKTLVNGKQVSCTWVPNPKATDTQAKGYCSSTQNPTPPTALTPSYCSGIPLSSCAGNRINQNQATLGCATSDLKTCNPFTGCSAYIQTTDALCQTISAQSTSDGIQCIQKEACSTYSFSQCTKSASSGSGTCKLINNACVDQVCSDLVSRSSCLVLQGCSWNGLTCQQSLSSCAFTLGTSTTCPVITGSDGPCKYVSGTNCAVKICADAPITVTKDTDCIAFMSSCLYSNGKGCVTTLPMCSTYLQSKTCSGYIGSDGPCETDEKSKTACRGQKCSDAQITLNTDFACAAFKSECVTTGKGCNAFRGLCSGYNGTTSTCAGYIGTDGYCKGQSEAKSAACVPKLCADNTSAITNSACNLFQIGCITNGRGCVSALTACNTYKLPEMAPCNELIGSDGLCMAPKGSEGTCQLSTSAICESYTTEPQCQQSPMCISANICNDNTSCASYSTPAMCAMNQAGPLGFMKPCLWITEKSTCTEKQCTSLIGSSYNNDASCNSVLVGCVYSGLSTGQCVEPDAGCSAFYGNNAIKSVCATAMKGTCWGSSSTIGACIDRICSFYPATTQTTDQLCSAFLSTCVSDGANACITPTKCSGYYGSATSCKAITSNTDFGLYGIYPCIPTSPNQTSGPCKAMTCADIIIGDSPWAIVTSSQCQTQNVNCTTTSNPGSGKQCIQFTLSLTNQSTSVSTSVTCTDNTTATSDKQCESYLPSPLNMPVNFNCKWNGKSGCVASGLQQCTDFSGTMDSCSKVTGAVNAPCKGKGTSSDSCLPTVCTDAPNSASTDTACNSFRIGCITNGNGCQSKPPVSKSGCKTFQNQSSCVASKLGGTGDNAYGTCAWAPTCLSRATTCNGASMTSCKLAALDKTIQNPLGTCSWYLDSQGTFSCRDTTCVDLPASNTTHAACSGLMPICTTNGAGCVTKGACNTYLNSLTCTSAATTEPINKCIWASGTGCRMQQCTDIFGTTDGQCNVNGIKNCRTNGIGCISSSNLDCQSLLFVTVCIKDGKNQPCLWIDGTCRLYLGCTSIAWTTHSQCQRILTGSTRPQCTSDGTRCQPLDSCQNYKNKTASCVIANDGSLCGIVPSGSNGSTSNQCQKSGACTDALGTTNAICQAYRSGCISNGTSCQTISTCASYTQTACENIGTDGACFWSSTVNLCRTQQCSDAITNNTTDAGCAAFPAPYINRCTTDGTICIMRSTCTSYTVQSSCVLGTDGACVWVTNTETGTCRTRQCTDLMSTTTPGCQNQIISSPATTSSIGTIQARYLACVSNGTNCIPKANCSSYTNQASCSGQYYGLDGTCAFTSGNGTIPTIGSCRPVSECRDIGMDQNVCNIYSDRCQFKPTLSGETTTSQCSAQDCVSKSNGQTCQPIPSFNYAYYVLCMPVSTTNSTCERGDGSKLTASTCFSGSMKTYTWNDTSSSCNCCVPYSVYNTSQNITYTYAKFSEIIRSSFLVFGALFTTY